MVGLELFRGVVMVVTMGEVGVIPLVLEVVVQEDL
ncbi:MAG: hypothetical protein BWY29_00858 [Microgenomates group bacterium ADurb.Bin238]|nr:MAG: hypothetical protein BWY29_00858 [Microgenomates group bacterium ADurb.Bin238]